MSEPNYTRTRRACYFTYVAMSSVFCLPSMLFTTFHRLYGISYTLLGTLILINFCTQLTIDLIFSFFSRWFNVKKTVRVMPLLTCAGMILYVVIPSMFPERAFSGLAAGTVVFSVAAGLCEVLLSPLVAAMPSEHPDRDMSMLHSLYGWGVVSVVAVSSLFFLLFSTEKWMLLTLILAALPLIASILFFLSPFPEMDVSSPPVGGSASRTRGILLCVACIFLGSASENAMTDWISSFMESALRIPKAAGDIFGLALFAFLLASTRTLYARFGRNIKKTLLVSMIGAAVCYLAAGLVNQVAAAFLACVLMGVFTSMLWPGTLILLEEEIPNPGVAAYALMAAGGDFGASVAPQLLGYLVDRVAAGNYAAELSASSGMTVDQIGMKAGMAAAAVYPILGTLVVLRIMRYFKRNGKTAA